MIVFDKVTKRFPLGNTALAEVSFHIADNDFIFLVGPSGAGKTTILKLITREYAPTTGKVTVNDLKDVVALRRSIGVVFQDFKILPDKNVFENIALSLKVIGMRPAEIKVKVREALDLVNLSHKEKVFPLQLSAGELQRVAIARAIVGDRQILLADEPTGNLDPKTSWSIIKIFRKLEGKRTIIVATHNIDIVNSMQKRVFMMKDGRLTKDIKKGGYEL